MARLRELLDRDVLAPGRRTSIEKIATLVGVSRTPVRDALRRLQTEGLVIIAPRVGVFVRAIGAREATDAYLIQRALEPLLVRWAGERAAPDERALLAETVATIDTDPRAAHEGMRHERARAALIAMARSPALHDALAVVDGRVGMPGPAGAPGPRPRRRAPCRCRAGSRSRQPTPTVPEHTL